MNRAKADAVEPEYLDVEHELPKAVDRADQRQGPVPVIRQEEASPSTELEQLKSERDALLNRVARNQADFENTRKRMEREQHEFKAFALEDALKSLLPTVDSLERALQSPGHDLEEFRRGVDLIRQQLEDALKKLGLRRIPAKGELFDPRLHEAVGTVDTAAAADTQVLEEVQGGYKYGDRLLRPVRVLVARNQEKQAS